MLPWTRYSLCVALFSLFMLLVRSNFNSPDYNKAHFAEKRSMHSEELLRLLEGYPSPRSIAIIGRTCKGLLETLKEAEQIVGQIGMNERPMNDSVGSAFATVFENTAFLLELALLFPDVIHAEVDNRQDILDLLRRNINLLEQSTLTSHRDEQVIAAAAQELYLVKRSDSYVNPFSAQRKMIAEKQAAAEARAKAKKEKRKKPKGPKLSPRRDDL